MMRSLGVIHARGGSKRIPKKNIKLLCGIPLIAYMIRASLESDIDRVVVSTDDEAIAAIARKYGAEVPFKRPEDIAEDVPSEFVTLHALEWVERDEGYPYDVVVTLQPTTPFATPEDINRCLAVLDTRSEVQSCFTVVQAVEPPQWMFTVNSDGIAKTFLDGDLHGERGVFQTLPPLYLPNGAAYATRVAALRKQNAVIASPAAVTMMSLERSVDIDEPIDWIIAETVCVQHNFLKPEQR